MAARISFLPSSLEKYAFSNAVVDDVRRSFLYHIIRLKLIQISFILNLLKPLYD